MTTTSHATEVLSGKVPVATETPGNQQVLVSVIIPIYNGLEYIAETLESIRAQTHKNIEIVVVDDGSTDGTVGFLKAQPDVTLVEQPNQGPGSARNNGASVASGDWLAFADGDDLWVPEKLELQLAATDEQDVELVYTNVRPIGDVADLPSLQHNPEAMPTGDIFVEILNDNIMTLSSVMMKRSAFEELGGFGSLPSIRGCEDWDLWLRYLDSDRKVGAVPEPLVLYRWRSDSMTANHAAMHGSRQSTLDRALKSRRALELSASERRQARANLFSCSAWFASRDGNARALRLYMQSVLAGGSVKEAIRGVARTVRSRLYRLIGRS